MHIRFFKRNYVIFNPDRLIDTIRYFDIKYMERINSVMIFKNRESKNWIKTHRFTLLFPLRFHVEIIELDSPIDRHCTSTRETSVSAETSSE